MIFYKQPDAMDCGSTCLRMGAKHYGKTYSLQSSYQEAQDGVETRHALSLHLSLAFD